ncbi:LacI family DNA-binding transcriptional regulator [Frigoribacterium sp. PhB24]|uniref:LacI family DNA-binding transcriptional regulator n=1 Tax=Frigoribacterium sp. PhB24 TaxID=2485204 RepID=UPI000F4AD7A1|nr:LacI family DNA-binding transcriptional regulator [Frigoribacterium sp. PhB24]
MREVAARAGVSIATVSFVVNGSRSVSPTTHQRVTDAMAELGYTNNVVARALASKRTRIVALLFPALEERLGGIALRMFMSAATRASELGYHLVLWPSGETERDVRDLVSGRLVDGVLVMEVQLHDSRVEALLELGLPFVSMGRTSQNDRVPFVDMDFEEAVEQALDHLESLGHQSIGLVLEDFSASPIVGYGPAARTEEAFRRSVARRGLRSASVTCGPSSAGGRRAAHDLVAALPDVTGVLIMKDDATGGLLSGLAGTGRHVPDDVSVVSLASSTANGAATEPTLTTLDAPGVEMGRLAVESLVARLDAGVGAGGEAAGGAGAGAGAGAGGEGGPGGEGELTQVLLPCVLHVAGSSGPAPGVGARG